MKFPSNRSCWKTIAAVLIFSLASLPILEAATLIIPQTTLIRVRLQESLSTRSTKEGQSVRFVVDTTVRLGTRVIFQKGDPVQAYVSEIRHPQRFGRNASLKIKFLSAQNVKGREVPIAIGDHASKTNQQMGMAAGAAVGGALVFGPLGLLAGLFVKGKNIQIPAGTVLNVEVSQDTKF